MATTKRTITSPLKRDIARRRARKATIKAAARRSAALATAWRNTMETDMPGYCLVNRTRVAQYIGDFDNRDACIAALGLPSDGVVERDPLHDNEPRLWLDDAPDALPRDGDRHPL